MSDLTDQQVANLQDVLVEHGSIFGAGNCRICGVARCGVWVDAYDKLAAENKPMVDASSLPPPVPERRR